MNDDGVPDQIRFVLRSLGSQESIEILKAIAGGPIFERSSGGGRFGWGVVPFPSRASLVSIVFQHLGDGGGGLRNDARKSIPIIGKFGDLAVSNAGVITAG